MGHSLPTAILKRNLTKTGDFIEENIGITVVIKLSFLQIVNKHMRRCSIWLAIRKYNQNHNEKALHTHQDGYNNNKKWKITSVREDMEQWEACILLLGM